jgi:hypothetical protein
MATLRRPERSHPARARRAGWRRPAIGSAAPCAEAGPVSSCTERAVGAHVEGADPVAERLVDDQNTVVDDDAAVQEPQVLRDDVHQAVGVDAQQRRRLDVGTGVCIGNVSAAHARRPVRSEGV